MAQNGFHAADVDGDNGDHDDDGGGGGGGGTYTHMAGTPPALVALSPLV